MNAYARLVLARLDWLSLALPTAVFACSLFFLLRRYGGCCCAPPRPDPGACTGRVGALFVFPVKSCAGVRVEEAEVTPSGLRAASNSLNADRAWAIVRRLGAEAAREAEEKFSKFSKFSAAGKGKALYEPITIRSHPRMVFVQPSFGAGGDDGWELRLSVPGGGTIEAPLLGAGGGSAAKAAVLRCVVWNSMCQGRDQGDDVAAFLTAYLESKQPLRLVHMGEEMLRPLCSDVKYGELEAERPDRVARFSDWSTFNMLSTQSVDWVNARIPWSATPTDAQTYRPNILVDAPYAFWEDALRECRVHAGGRDGDDANSGGGDDDDDDDDSGGGARFSFAKHCGRCTLPTINRRTGKRSADLEPLRTLKKYRTNFYPHLDRKKSGPVPFLGVNVSFGGRRGGRRSKKSRRVIRVGDTVTPIETMAPPEMLLGRDNPWGAKYF
jgi:uncharacterized protein YcbX